MTTAREVLADCVRLFDEALPKFNWGASALDANAIRLLNEVPAAARALLAQQPPAQMLTESEVSAIVREAAKGSATRRDGSTSSRIARAIERAVLRKNGLEAPK